MTDDASPENLRKFLESDDPAMVRMGISLAKGTGVEITIKDLEHFLKSEDVETIKMGFAFADEAGVGDEAMEMLCEALEDNDEGFRAAEALGEIGDTRAVEPLLWLLELPVNYSWSVATVLGKIGDKRAAGPLLGELLDVGEELDDDPYVRFGSSVWDRQHCEAVSEALAQIGDTQVIKPLVAALDDMGWWLPFLAAQSLAGMGWKPETDEQKTDYLVASHDWKGCIQMGEPVVEKAVRYLTRLFSYRDECYYRDEIEWDLQNFGEAAVEPLIEMFESDKSQWEGSGDAECAVNALVSVLSESEERRASRGLPGIKVHVRKTAIARLKAPLIELLEDDESYVRWYANDALRKLGHEVE